MSKEFIEDASDLANLLTEMSKGNELDITEPQVIEAKENILEAINQAFWSIRKNSFWMPLSPLENEVAEIIE